MPKAFKNWTIQERLVAYLESKGFVKLPSTTRKYIKMRHPVQAPACYLLGKSGAFRKSPDGTVGASFPVTTPVEFEIWCTRMLNQ